MAFTDTLGGTAMLVNLENGGCTTAIESKTNSLAAMPDGIRVIGKTTMVWKTRVKSENGKLCAAVIQTQMVLPA